jgi:hypothetical protein
MQYSEFRRQESGVRIQNKNNSGSGVGVGIGVGKEFCLLTPVFWLLVSRRIKIRTAL